MGQKVQPTGFRIGIFEDWQSRWYASKKEYGDLLLEDERIRRYLKAKFAKAGVPKIEIERTRDEVKVILHVAKPGMVKDKRRGEDIDTVQVNLQELMGRRINLKILEMHRPEIDAQLVSEDIAEQLQRRVSFRRAMKRSMEQVMDAGARGVKMQLSGRLAGAEMARCEKALAGAVPLTTLRAKISYGFTEAKTAQGNIGIKVWINQGFYDVEESDGAHAQAGKVPQKPKRKSKR